MLDPLGGLSAQWIALSGFGGGCLFSACIYTFFHKQEELLASKRLSTEKIAREKAQKSMRLSERRLRSIIATTNEGFWLMDSTGRTLDVNDALCSMIGFDRDNILGRHPSDFIDEKSKRGFINYLSQASSLSPRDFEVALHSKDGKIIYTRFNATVLKEDPASSDPSMIFAFVSDISERKRYEDELYRQAHYDPTSNLPNRRLLSEHLKSLISAAENFGLLLLDLDNFKLYNDTMGHTFGDLILAEVADRLNDEVRRHGGLLSRLGGDEFVIVLHKDRDNVADLAKRCLAILSDVTTVDGLELYVGASIGAVFYPHDGNDHIQLLKNADLAMYEAKSRGKARICFYDSDMGNNSRRKLDTGNMLHKALDRDEFTLHYQPQVNPVNGRIVGVEALLRWQPHGGPPVSPSDFIPVLEETGLIVQVGNWAMSTACAQAGRWHSSGYPIRLSVNLSARQFQESDLSSNIQQILLETHLNPSALCLEITESLLLDNLTHVTRKLEALTSLGVTFSIDDFGTGYSSLSYLQKLPIRELKIDRSFIADLPQNAGDAILVKTIVAMAKSLNLETVAEGVESEDQALALTDLGVDIVQGYFYGKPVPAETMERAIISCLRRSVADAA